MVFHCSSWGYWSELVTSIIIDSRDLQIEPGPDLGTWTRDKRLDLFFFGSYKRLDLMVIDSLLYSHIYSKALLGGDPKTFGIRGREIPFVFVMLEIWNVHKNAEGDGHRLIWSSFSTRLNYTLHLLNIHIHIIVTIYQSIHNEQQCVTWKSLMLSCNEVWNKEICLRKKEKRKKKGKGKPLQLQVKFVSTYGKHNTERNHKSSQLLVTIITVFFF